jgi:hypothetical protein
MPPNDQNPDQPPAPITPTQFDPVEITPLLAAAIHGVEVAAAYERAGLTRAEAIGVMTELTKPQICGVCRGKLQ